MPMPPPSIALRPRHSTFSASFNARQPRAPRFRTPFSPCLDDDRTEALLVHYFDDLRNKVSIKGFVDDCVARLRNDFNRTTANRNLTFPLQHRKIERKLNLFGNDSTFSLLEIFDVNPFRLKEEANLRITITTRLNQSGWLNIINSTRNVNTSVINYYYVPDNMELTWISIEETDYSDSKRYPWIDILNENSLFTSSTSSKQVSFDVEKRTTYLLDLYQLINTTKDLNYFLSEIASLLSSFIASSHYEDFTPQQIRDLIKILKGQKKPPYAPHRFQVHQRSQALIVFLSKILVFQTVLFQESSIDLILRILRDNSDPLLFTSIVRSLFHPTGKYILENLGKDFILHMLTQGIHKSSIPTIFLTRLGRTYWEEYQNTPAKEDVLQVTQSLLKEVLNKEFRDFNDLSFPTLPYFSYLSGLDFSNCHLEHVNFYDEIKNCNFNHAHLLGSTFHFGIETATFVGTDLRHTYFPAPDNSSSNFDLSFAILSTATFKDLIRINITSFKYADLRFINFQEIMAEKQLILDLSSTDLDNCNLNGLDFSQVLLYGSSMKYAFLQGMYFSDYYLNKYTSIQGSQLDTYAIPHFHRAGIVSFDSCQIIEERNSNYMDFSFPILMNITLQDLSFKKARFLGNLHNFTFQSCNMETAQFIPLPTENSIELAHVTFNNVNLRKSFFQNAKLHTVKFNQSPLDNSTFKNVEIHTNNLFELYQAGHYDFTQVKEIRGELPKRINQPYYPLSDARLGKNVFIHLYKQGLRDFRGSDLTHFNFIETLNDESISVLGLRLEGTQFRQSLFYCALPPSPSCTIHFLLSKLHSPKLISISDLQYLLRPHLPESDAKLIETLLGPMSFYSLRGGVGKICIYWGYKTEDEELASLFAFLRDSIKRLKVETLTVRIYILKKFENNILLNTLRSLLYRNLKLRDVVIYYYNRERAIAGVDLGGNRIPVEPAYDTLIKNKQFSFMVTDAELDRVHSIIQSEANQLSVYRLIRFHLHKKINYRFPTTRNQGAKYNLGLALMHTIAIWLVSPSESLDTTRIDEDEETDLIIETRLLKNEKPLNKLGERLSIDFDKQKAAFIENQTKEGSFIVNSSTLEWHRSTTVNTGNSSNGIRRNKRILPCWYTGPAIVSLMKPIQHIFSTLDLDLLSDPGFSESLLAGYLYDFWLILSEIGISSNTPQEVLVSLLQDARFQLGILLRNPSFLVELQTLYKNHYEDYIANSTVTPTSMLEENFSTLSSVNIEQTGNISLTELLNELIHKQNQNESMNQGESIDIELESNHSRSKREQEIPLNADIPATSKAARPILFIANLGKIISSVYSNVQNIVRGFFDYPSDTRLPDTKNDIETKDIASGTKFLSNIPKNVNNDHKLSLTAELKEKIVLSDIPTWVELCEKQSKNLDGQASLALTLFLQEVYCKKSAQQHLKSKKESLISMPEAMIIANRITEILQKEIRCQTKKTFGTIEKSKLFHLNCQLADAIEVRNFKKVNELLKAESGSFTINGNRLYNTLLKKIDPIMNRLVFSGLAKNSHRTGPCSTKTTYSKPANFPTAQLFRHKQAESKAQKLTHYEPRFH